jgi:hypothetical protein
MRMAAALVLFVLPTAAASAQPVPQASIGLPLPSIGLPLPVIGLPPGQDLGVVPPPALPKPGREQHGHRPPTIVLFGAPYAFGFERWQQSLVPGVVAEEPVLTSRSAAPLPATGTLQLELRPRDAQLFVDGEYVGTWADLVGELQLSPGAHRIEVRAATFEPLTFAVRIEAGRTITYRGALTAIPDKPRSTPDSAAPSANPQRREPKAPPVPATFYLIPGCYLGNVPPEQVKLPDGCDLSRIITHQPKR